MPYQSCLGLGYVSTELGDTNLEDHLAGLEKRWEGIDDHESKLQKG